MSYGHGEKRVDNKTMLVMVVIRVDNNAYMVMVTIPISKLTDIIVLTIDYSKSQFFPDSMGSAKIKRMNIMHY